MGDGFTGQKTQPSTNSVKVLREHKNTQITLNYNIQKKTANPSAPTQSQTTGEGIAAPHTPLPSVTVHFGIHLFFVSVGGRGPSMKVCTRALQNLATPLLVVNNNNTRTMLLSSC